MAGVYGFKFDYRGDFGGSLRVFKVILLLLNKPLLSFFITDNCINMILLLTAFQVVFSFRVYSQPKGFTWKWKAILNY